MRRAPRRAPGKPGGRAGRGGTGVPIATPVRRGEAVPRPEPEAPEPKVSLEELIQEPVKGPIKILFLDVDGTLTDGVIEFHRHDDSRHFWVRDGIALGWARDLGVHVTVISGRSSEAVSARMEELGLELHQGVQDKVAVAKQVIEREGASWQQCVMVGDDLPDVPLLKRVGWPIAVSDAVPEVRAIARTVTGARAGHGAIREVVEMILRHNGTWGQVLRRYEVK